jgi:hypothetical protein
MNASVEGGVSLLWLLISVRDALKPSINKPRPQCRHAGKNDRTETEAGSLRLRIHAVYARDDESDRKRASDGYIRYEQRHGCTALRVASVYRNHGAGDLSRSI